MSNQSIHTVDSYSAAFSMIGYLYQIRYALFKVLELSDNATISIETADDVSIERIGYGSSLYQLKHKSANLTNLSPDFWKTIRIWAELYNNNLIQLSDTKLFLVTTAEISSSSGIAFLTPEKYRPSKAFHILDQAILNTTSDDLKKILVDYFAMPKGDRKALFDAIQVLDNSSNVIDIVAEIKNSIRYSQRPEYIDHVYERLEGWWFGIVADRLNQSGSNTISGLDVHLKLRDIADQFLPNALPIDFWGELPSEKPDPQSDSRMFVLQLRHIAIHHKRIEKAIVDYYRAFSQRSRWAREDLLCSSELESYENKLIDEWERVLYWLSDEHQLDLEADYSDESLLVEVGRRLYDWVEHKADIRIRSDVREEYVMRGSYHILANEVQPRVWWHPQFVKKLKAILTRQPSKAVGQKDHPSSTREHLEG
jgi:hypothetical protein